MPCTTKLERMQQKNTSTALRVPTVPTVADSCTTGWLATDIYKGEFYVNFADDRVFTRTDGGIREFPWITDIAGNVQNQINLIMGANAMNIIGTGLGVLSLGTGLGVPAYAFLYTQPISSDEVLCGLTDETGLGGTVQAFLSHENSATGHVMLVTADTNGGRLFSDDGSGQEIQIEAGLNQASMQYDDGTVIAQVLASSGDTTMRYNNGIGTLLDFTVRSAGAPAGFIFDTNGSVMFGIGVTGQLMTNQIAVVTPTLLEGRMPIYDAAGVFAGYVPIYDIP